VNDGERWGSERARLVFCRLAEGSGAPEWDQRGGNALEELVGTILSQHTSDVNAERAYQALRARFPTWQAVLEADPAAVAEAIRAGGLAEVKAHRIQAVLAAIQAERGALDLEFLRALPTEQARAYLEALPGVGPKTAACVLVFALGKPAIPVDTHVHRVARRLELIPPGMNADAAHRALEAQVPERFRYAFHVLLIRHGRAICRAPIPRCESCPLLDLCPRVGVVGAPAPERSGRAR